MPAAIGITARRDADVVQRGESPWPSVPSTRASRSTPDTASSTGTASSARVSATVVNPRASSCRQGVVPVVEAGPRHGEDGAHADLHRPPVERVGAARREQHGVDAECGAAAHDRADVGVVDDVLEHQHGPRRVEHLVQGGQGLALQGGQRASVHVEAGHLLGECLGHDEARRVGVREHVGQPVQPAWCHHERPGHEAGLDGPSYHLLALGQEQPVLGLEVRPELDVAEVPVVGQPWVGGIGDLDQGRHGVTGRRRP